MNISEIVSEARARKDELIKDGLGEDDFEEALAFLENILNKNKT